jgi:ribonuclease P/MRP protein subunit POP5
MKSRPPTLRVKKRYILARIDPPGAEPEPRELYYAILDAITSLFGDCIAAETGLALISFESGYAEIRCTRGFECQVRIALATVHSVHETTLAIRALVTSGTLLALRKKIARIRPGQPVIIFPLDIEGSTYSARRYQGQKVDLVEKGIKGQELLFLTQDDLEEL